MLDFVKTYSALQHVPVPRATAVHPSSTPVLVPRVKVARARSFPVPAPRVAVNYVLDAYALFFWNLGSYSFCFLVGLSNTAQFPGGNVVHFPHCAQK